MKLISKFRGEIFIFSILIFFYFLLRLPNLTLQPIFADEAIYIRWAQVMRAEPSLRFLPLSDGKTPLFMWLMIPLFKVFSDPLFAGRFLSVISGLFTLLGVYFLSKRVFSERSSNAGKQTAFWASLLYVITPYTVFFDRMALVDSMLSAFTVWIVYFSIKLVQLVKFNLSILLGIVLGGAILTKTPGMIDFFLLPVSILGFHFDKSKVRLILKLFFLWTVAITIGFILYNFLRLSPEFHQLSARNQDYIFSPTELIDRPLDPFIPHLRDISNWFPKLLTWPILFCGAVGLFYILSGFHKLGLVLFLWGFIPLILEMAFLKTFTARYLLPVVPTFLMISGYGIYHILPRFVSHKPLSFILMMLVVLPLALQFNYFLLTDPQKAPLPRAERKGYFEEWTAGYGLKEIGQYLVEQRKKGSVIVGTEGYFGTLPDGLFIYLDKEGIPVIGSHPTSVVQLADALSDHQVFFVTNGNRLPNASQSLKLEKILEFPKAKSPDTEKQDAIILYRLLPNF